LLPRSPEGKGAGRGSYSRCRAVFLLGERFFFLFLRPLFFEISFSLKVAFAMFFSFFKKKNLKRRV
jgi:hypothetical protein